MKSLEQIQEHSLKANFTEVQQQHFDKLMAELEQISGGLGFSDLKEKAEAGNREVLQVMRDYIAKKEQIVRFIETKDPLPEIKVNDTVVFTDITGKGEIGVVEDIVEGMYQINTGRKLSLFRGLIAKLIEDPEFPGEEFIMETDKVVSNMGTLKKGMKISYKLGDSVYTIQGFKYNKLAKAVRVILKNENDTVHHYFKQLAEFYDIVRETEV